MIEEIQDIIRTTRLSGKPPVLDGDFLLAWVDFTVCGFCGTIPLNKCLNFTNETGEPNLQ